MLADLVNLILSRTITEKSSHVRTVSDPFLTMLKSLTPSYYGQWRTLIAEERDQLANQNHPKRRQMRIRNDANDLDPMEMIFSDCWEWRRPSPIRHFVGIEL
jgi:hypothetical protein